MHVDDPPTQSRAAHVVSRAMHHKGAREPLAASGLLEAPAPPRAPPPLPTLALPMSLLYPWPGRARELWARSNRLATQGPLDPEPSTPPARSARRCSRPSPTTTGWPRATSSTSSLCTTMPCVHASRSTRPSSPPSSKSPAPGLAPALPARPPAPPRPAWVQERTRHPCHPAPARASGRCCCRCRRA